MKPKMMNKPCAGDKYISPNGATFEITKVTKTYIFYMSKPVGVRVAIRGKIAIGEFVALAENTMNQGAKFIPSKQSLRNLLNAPENKKLVWIVQESVVGIWVSRNACDSRSMARCKQLYYKPNTTRIRRAVIEE